MIGRAGEAGRRDDEDTVDADGDEVVSGGDAREVLTRVANASVWGVMVVQYPERDVRVSMDGDAALRLLAMYAGAPVRGYEDRVDLGVCDARCSWVGVDVARALGLFWVPSELLAAGRTTIDPVPAGVAV
ncbi:MAG: hypothetical protein M5T61_15575 [Acidimicrobiia bacterium]|nr:hypothetical protein [Acidimicrobiia bacterium]